MKIPRFWGAWDPKRMLAKASPFSQLQGRSPQLPAGWASLPSPSPGPGSSNLSTAPPGHTARPCRRSAAGLASGARSSGGPGRSPGPESRWTTAKPRLFSWPRLPAPQWGEGGSGKGRWQVGEKADCEFLEGRACHLYAWHLLSTLPGAQWTSVNANPRSSLCPTPACSSFPR